MPSYHRSSSSHARTSVFRRRKRNLAIRRRLLVEQLEVRTLLSTWTVLNVNDSGAGSLREAVDLANANPGSDTIEFDIGGGGPQTIQLQSPLPTVTDAVVVDGTTQPGFLDLPIVEVDGATASPVLTLAADDSTVRGLAIRTNGTAISLSGADRALISNLDVSWTGEGTSGIGIDFKYGSNNVIEYVNASNRSTGIRLGVGVWQACADNRFEYNDLSGAADWAFDGSQDAGLGNEYLGNDLSGSANGARFTGITGLNLTAESFLMSGIPGTALKLHAVSGSTISGLDASWMGEGASGIGVDLSSSSNNSMGSLLVAGRGTGVRFVNSSNNTVHCTSILDSATGVYISGLSSGVALNNSHIGGNSDDGVANAASAMVNADPQ